MKHAASLFIGSALICANPHTTAAATKTGGAGTAAATKAGGVGKTGGVSLGALLAGGDLKGAQQALGDPLLAAGAAGLGNGEVQAGLARHEVVRACGADALSALAKREGGAAFLKAFLGEPGWVESFLVSDPPAKDYAQAAENLYLLHRYGKDLEQPIYRRLATAVALSSGKKNPYLLVERFGQIQRAHRDGLLHASFDQLDVREMRWAVYLGGNAAEFDYMVNDRQTPLRDYFGACWAVAYRGFNDYGDSIQGPWYHEAFRHEWPGLRAAREVGGVCGSLSTYGAMAARAHGIMATTVGQPGHCAYVLRVGDEYPVGNSVTWPTAAAAPGWEGTGYATMHRLYEPVSKDLPRLLAANRGVWLARLQIDRARPTAEWTASFEQAIAAQPLNYDTWLEYEKALVAAKEVPPLDLARRAAKTFAPYPEAAWALVQRIAEKPLAALKPEERMAFLLECHSELREEKADRFTDYPFENVLAWQIKSLGKDAALGVEFFSKLVAIHTAKAPYQHVFTRVMGWGTDRFASKPETAALFAKAMESYFRAQGDGADPAMMRRRIGDGLRAAGTAGDLPSFQAWAQMAGSLLPAVEAKDLFLNTKQVAAFPKVEAFPGEVLSEKGLLKTSSACQFDRPLSYPALLKPGGFGGYFDTNGEAGPWAVVQLPGEGELSGIVIVDRYEFPTELPWSMPLKISVSSDGKTWSEVASFSEAQPMYRVSLAEKGIKARFVKAERLPDKKDRFHLRNFVVYGKPLY